MSGISVAGGAGALRVWAGSVYPPTAASTRLRLGLLREPLIARGADFREWSYISDADLTGWIAGGLGRVMPALRSTAQARRGAAQARQASVIIVQRELLPWNTLVMEHRLANGRPMVWDVDDAIWNASTGMRARVRGDLAKYEWLARFSAVVWAGNEMVAEWCSAHGARNVQLVPTVTPIPATVGTPTEPRRLAWVGTPSTGPFVERLLLENRDTLREWVIEIVGAQITPPPGLRVEQHQWSQQSEARALERAWAGIYPIDTAHPLASGKSALKAVLMGAYGLPVIATRTRSNAAVIEDGVTGFLVSDREGWKAALADISDPGVRAMIGSAARRRIERDFNPALWGAALADCVERL